MMARSSVTGSGSGAVKAGDSGATRPAPDPAEPPAQDSTTKSETSESTETAVKEEPVVKQEPLDSSGAGSAEPATGQAPGVTLNTQESGVFTPTAAPPSPEREQREGAASAPPRGTQSAASRGVKIVKDESAPTDRRSSSYLYNDWDRTLYEKTGRPPPGEAHWSRDKSAHSDRSPARAGGAESCSHSRGSAQPAARSASARRRPRSRRRPVTSPGGRRAFDMARCQRETQDQFGRRIVYRHCFIEPEFTLRGQRIPVHGARKGSIVNAEDTYAAFALELVTPPSEGQLSAEKVQRRARLKKRRRKKRRRSPGGKSLLRERALIEEQRQRLEEEGEKLEEDRIRLEGTRRHLEQLEEWWVTEGLQILQRNELREQEEKIINAVIEEECQRIREERRRLQEEWQFLVERVERQEKEERRVQEALQELDERQEELAQHERAGMRRIHEMKAVFDIERRMMEVDRKKLMEEALTSEAFRDALEDAELGCWESLSEDGRSRSRVSSASRGARQPEPPDPFTNIKDSRLERLLADIIHSPGAAEPEQRHDGPTSAELRQRSSELLSPEPSCLSPELVCSESDQRCVPLREDGPGHPPSGNACGRPQRPITARGRPARASRSTPSGDARTAPAALPPCAARSEGGAAVTPGRSTGDGLSGGGEIADIWRRRPTAAQRRDPCSEAAIAEDRSPAAGSEGSGAAPAIPDRPQPEHHLPAPAAQRQHAKSEGFIDPSARRAEAERRRASAAPCLETASQPSSLRSGLRSADSVQRRVSFDQRATVQTVSDGAAGGAGEGAGGEGAEGERDGGADSGQSEAS
ncbi:golgin subfamily A member 6-like protein 2 [Amphibalanus amphitrite]|uniref:golgin subfamily A member 6-like protein 2 n=1 Tax=Amphibalanus amphitrite TaxID=1232801 RepID=UPI001C904C3C|nr:golgin subfamily A member 6-like protein 2 [Amphibalanus amphitrite]